MPKPLPPSALRWQCDPDGFDFKTTQGLPHGDLLSHQERPIKALRLALRMKRLDYNVYVSGAPRLSKTRTVRALVDAEAKARPTPSDWVYVYNFSEADAPVPLELPPGRGKILAADLHSAVEDLKEAIGLALYGDAQQGERQAHIRAFEETREALLVPVEQMALSQGFILDRKKLSGPLSREALDPSELLTPIEEAMDLRDDTLDIPAPDSLEEDAIERDTPEEGTLTDDPPIHTPEEGEADRRMRQQEVMDRLEQLLWKLDRAQDRLDKTLDALQRDAARGATKPVMEALRANHGDTPQVAAHLEAMEADILSNLNLFLQKAGDVQSLLGLLGGGEDVPEDDSDGLSRSLRRYYGNVIVDNSHTAGAPVILEGNPTYANLLGRIEQEANQGVISTHFLRIKGGAIHRAIGGFLILRAEDLLHDLSAYEGLKRAIRHREIRLEDPSDDRGAFTTRWLKPGPIPLQGTRIILTGTEDTLDELSEEDPDFQKLFKVIAQFSEVGPREQLAKVELPGFISALGDREGLLPLDVGGVGALAELALRDAEDRIYLSTRQGVVADLVREGDYFARERGGEVVTRGDILEAWQNRQERSGLLADRIFEDLSRGFIHFNPKGSKVGQIHGMVVGEGVYGEGFGYPCRITAKVGAGAGRITSIQREVKLGGAIYGKGVLVMEGFLRSRIAQVTPLRARISVVMEQAYVPIDGDSASAAELIVIMSALAEAPIRQDIAMTGAMDQGGAILPVGGINEKIEGLFRAMSDQGLTGTQGVIIPKSNLDNLQLDEAVVKAVEAEEFRVYAVESIDEAIDLLVEGGSERVFKAGESRLKSLWSKGIRKRPREGGDQIPDVEH